MFRGDHPCFRGGHYGVHSRRGPGCEQDKKTELIKEFKQFRAYTEQRLEEIGSAALTNEKLEHEEDTLKLHLDLMKDEDEDLSAHGLDQLQSYVDRMFEMVFRNPTQTQHTERSTDQKHRTVLDDNGAGGSPALASGSINCTPTASRDESSKTQSNSHGRVTGTEMQRGARRYLSGSRGHRRSTVGQGVGRGMGGGRSRHSIPQAPIPTNPAGRGRMSPHPLNSSYGFDNYIPSQQQPQPPAYAGLPRSSSLEDNIEVMKNSPRDPHVQADIPVMEPNQILLMIPVEQHKFIMDLQISPGDLDKLDRAAKFHGWTFSFVLEQFVMQQCSPQESEFYGGILQLLLQGRLSLPGVCVWITPPINHPQ